jgi:hypothetical protein
MGADHQGGGRDRGLSERGRCEDTRERLSYTETKIT